jgi:pimeloyl-ACP methyl ester carboxylesterase
VLIIRGADSDVLPTLVAAEMLLRQARARLCTIPDVAHSVPRVRPRELAQAIISFIGRSETGDSRNG